jgi:hypothetical protein
MLTIAHKIRAKQEKTTSAASEIARMQENSFVSNNIGFMDSRSPTKSKSRNHTDYGRNTIDEEPPTQGSSRQVKSKKKLAKNKIASKRDLIDDLERELQDI